MNVAERDMIAALRDIDTAIQTPAFGYCYALVATQSQTPWPPPSIPAVDPTTASTTISRRFLSDEQHRLLTSPSFGQRLTTRPRQAARPATRRDWTPIWPGGQGADAELDQITGDEGSEFFPTATSVEPGPQPPTVGPRAGAGADGGVSPPPTASEAEKSGVSEPEAAPEEGKETTREGSRQTTAQTPWEDSELTTEEGNFPTTLETFPTTLETFPTTPEAFTTAPTRASNGTWPGRGTTDDGFSTGTYHYTTGAAFDYPTGPTGFTSHGGVTGRPGSHFASGSTRTTGTTTDTTVGTTPGTSRGTTPSTSTSPGITHSSVVPPVELYVQFLIGTTWPRFCRVRQAFKQRVVDLVNGETHRNLTADSAVLFNIPVCGRPVRARRETDPSSTAILVFLYLTDSDGQYDRALTERVEPLWESAAAGGGGGSSWDGMARLVREVDTVQPEQLVQTQEHSERAGVIAAITVGCVAVASLVLLAVLLVVVRHRRRAAQTAQRCNPVNMEEYGVESVFSSMRRKNKMRRSVRSYLNQAFDDHDAPSNAVNFAGLANLSGDLAALKEEFDSIPTGAMPTLDDLPPGSEDRNRYANVLPVPETRVVLDQKTGAPNSDYINANYVRGPKDEPQFYIATQGPLESTVNDFWRMIWETQSKVVICLTDIVERGVRRCAEYLPPSEALDRHRLYGDFQVTLMAKTKKDKFVVSTIQLKNMDSNLFREVTHLWYSGWPERGVPSDLDSMVEFLQEARRAMKTNIGPTVVHCSPGTGRTGVLLACDICMRQFDATRTTDIMRTVFRIRHDRAGAVQTREQYALIYKVLNQYAASVTSGNLPALE
ncbi:Tyrosine-protein phosphatase non-receptor type 7 [Amphibalanus amphitrite]|uniref:Tyrosine-protein phosphatase non-receptor type 7 n=1 Tax=Amphibalanus amphitrite TaxID=1232801 RepID=A0A6A4X8T9_AMPAM|nr:Tyrosine-protein phosphatase non-receptor type 7 [Amphibalanus amphitrite]